MNEEPVASGIAEHETTVAEAAENSVSVESIPDPVSNAKPVERQSNGHVPVEERTPVHTIYLHNIDYNVTYDEIWQFCNRYGTIKEIWYPLSKPGQAFCTFYDIRVSIECVKDGMGKLIRGRPVKTNFAFKPPSHTRRDPKGVCSTILVKSEKEESVLTLERVKDAMSAFGEIRSCEQRSANEFIIKYYDLRNSQKCAEQESVNLRGETLTMQMLPEEDLGDEMVGPVGRRTDSGRRIEPYRDDRRRMDDRYRRPGDDRGRDAYPYPYPPPGYPPYGGYPGYPPYYPGYPPAGYPGYPPGYMYPPAAPGGPPPPPPAAPGHAPTQVAPPQQAPPPPPPPPAPPVQETEQQQPTLFSLLQ